MGDGLTTEELRGLVIWLRKANKDIALADEAAECIETLNVELLELRAENTRLRERCGELEPLRSGVHVVEP